MGNLIKPYLQERRAWWVAAGYPQAQALKLQGFRTGLLQAIRYARPFMRERRDRLCVGLGFERDRLCVDNLPHSQGYPPGDFGSAKPLMIQLNKRPAPARTAPKMSPAQRKKVESDSPFVAMAKPNPPIASSAPMPSPSHRIAVAIRRMPSGAFMFPPLSGQFLARALNAPQPRPLLVKKPLPVAP